MYKRQFNAFGDFEDDALVRITPKEIKKTGKAPKNGNIFFTIFQSFMAGEEEESEDGGELDQWELEKGIALAAEGSDGYQVTRRKEAYFGQYPRDYFDFIIIDECHRGGANDESSWRAIMEYFSPAVQLGLTATPRRDVNADTYDYFGEPIYTYKLKDCLLYTSPSPRDA